MDNYFMLVFSGASLLIALGIVVLRRYHRKEIKVKDLDIVYHIHEQDRLAKELEYVNVEKKVMEKMLEKKIEGVIFMGERAKEELKIKN